MSLLNTFKNTKYQNTNTSTWVEVNTLVSFEAILHIHIASGMYFLAKVMVLLLYTILFLLFFRFLVLKIQYFHY